MTDIKIVKDVTYFFHQRISEASDKLKIELNDAVKYYICRMLSERTHQSESSKQLESKPLGIELLNAFHQKSKTIRCAIFKEIGDQALYESGYLYEKVMSSIVDRKYYQEIGQNAYVSLSNENIAVQANDLFQALAERFEHLMLILSTISDLSDDPVRIYEKWRETKDENLARRLEKFKLQL